MNLCPLTSLINDSITPLIAYYIQLILANYPFYLPHLRTWSYIFNWEKERSTAPHTCICVRAHTQLHITDIKTPWCASNDALMHGPIYRKEFRLSWTILPGIATCLVSGKAVITADACLMLLSNAADSNLTKNHVLCKALYAIRWLCARV